MLLWLASAASAACPSGPATSSILVDHSELAILAYADLDEAGMRNQLQLARRAIPCLAELVLPADAASVHRAMGFEYFADGDAEGAAASFRAALGLQPQYRLPSTLAPPDGPVAVLYAQAAATTEPTSYPLPDPSQGDVYVDGTRSLRADLGLPAIVQVMQDNGAMHWGGVVRRPDDLPAWFVPSVVTAPIAPPLPEPIPHVAPPPPPLRTSGRGTLLATTIVTAAGAGALLGGAAWTRRGYDVEPTASGRRLTNSLYLGSAGVGIVSLGLGIATIAIPGSTR